MNISILSTGKTTNYDACLHSCVFYKMNTSKLKTNKIICNEFDDSVIQWLEIILLERFGHTFQLEKNEQGQLYLALTNHSDSIVFDTLIPEFFTATSELSFCEWDASCEGYLPVLGKPLPAPGMISLPSPLVEQTTNGYNIHYDVLGLTYWMLSRQEEVGRTDLDEHGRFPAISSHAFKFGYLERPIIDEWLDILGQVISRQWPQLKLKQHQPRTLVSCDVDSPYLCYSKSFKTTIRVMVGDLLKRKSPLTAVYNLYRYFQLKLGYYEKDPYRAAIDWMMDVNELAGNKVAFYFIPEHLHTTYDGCYNMNESVIQNLLQCIHTRGHELGLHASYTTYKNKNQTQREVNILHNAISEEGGKQVEMGGRQHYLRYETPITARNWEAAGMNYDSTLGYADRPGFRCGTCHEYPMFDPVQGKILKLRQRPLILMECTIIDKTYMGLGYTEQTTLYMKKLKNRCVQVGGNFTLLWHNSHLTTQEDKNIYMELIQ